jgi:phage terminase large subunit-like protein
MAIETWEHEGQKWKTITHETRERYIVGVDLGHSCDPTAICVMRYKRTPLRDKPAWHKANSSIPKRAATDAGKLLFWWGCKPHHKADHI